MLNDYLICALWSSTGDDDISLDRDHDIDDVSPETRIESNTDILSAIMLADNACADWHKFWSDEQFGHDLWLTRCGHGTGFWDRYTCGRGEEIGNTLTSIAKSLGNVDLYVGDDNLIYSA